MGYRIKPGWAIAGTLLLFIGVEGLFAVHSIGFFYNANICLGPGCTPGPGEVCPAVFNFMSYGDYLSRHTWLHPVSIILTVLGAGLFIAKAGKRK